MVKIDREFQTLIPPLTADEYKRLEKSILLVNSYNVGLKYRLAIAQPF